jgi:peptidyl-tRNA hydrolase, PTH1 family
MWLLVGLGNPGPKYANNRHNIGFMVIDEIAMRRKADGWKAKFGGEIAQAELVGGPEIVRVALLKPMEYMNVSGHAVQRAAAFYQVEPKQVIVIHDEIDLELGRLKLKVGGGHGGHNGLRSIIQELGSPDFARVRCGTGRPGHAKGNVSDFVLGDFAKSEQTEVAILIKEAADAVEEMVKKGPLLAMNRFNAREKDSEKQK